CERLSIGGVTHPLCRKPGSLDGLWSFGIYQGNLQKSIQKIKYQFVSDIVPTLVNLMILYWSKNSPLFLMEVKKDQGVNWLVVPVPLHPKREKFRGFNQSGILAELITKKLDLKYADALKRVRFTKPQVSLKSVKRYQNVKGAFVLNLKFLPAGRQGSIQNTNIILIDDVWTTGSTLKECCSVLKKAGVKKVWGVTLAR
ncbi:MAG: ComF family protein, partial [Candidatus Daviesbacteria bacterium]|nr:ComF family protein [Candidatus Daviesbacteria bacterium]